MSELKDLNLPAKAIFKVNEDGSALRNDGVELAAANSNVWYVLATIHDEQREDWDTELEVQNQRAWNGWIYQSLSAEKQGSFAEDFDFTHDEMTVLKKVDRKAIRKAFQLRLPGIEPPKITERCKFSKNYFSKPVSFKKYAFVKRTCFRAATFSGKSDFREAVFSGMPISARLRSARTSDSIRRFSASTLAFVKRHSTATPTFIKRNTTGMPISLPQFSTVQLIFITLFSTDLLFSRTRLLGELRTLVLLFSIQKQFLIKLSS